MITKEQIKGMYDGSLFFALAKQNRAKKAAKAKVCPACYVYPSMLIVIGLIKGVYTTTPASSPSQTRTGRQGGRYALHPVQTIAC